MTIRLALPAAALAAAFVACAWPPWADEPQPKAARPRNVEELDPDVKNARVRLAGEIDRSLEASAYADLVSTLIAPNPLGIDVAVPDAALQAQLGLIKDQGVVVTAVPEE